jgi:predicted nucleic acid-binding protein
LNLLRRVVRVKNFMKTDVRAALDSNVLIYAEDMNADPRHMAAQKLLLATPSERFVIPTQVLGETMQWLIRKAKVPKQQAVDRVLEWAEQFETQPTTISTLRSARDLVAHHDLQFWDAVILSAAFEAGSDMLLSEDLQHGFQWRNVIVINPFLSEPHSLFQALTTK